MKFNVDFRLILLSADNSAEEKRVMAYKHKREYIEKMFAGYPDCMIPEEAGKCLRIGKNKIYEMLKDGMLPYIDVRGRYCIPKEVLIDYVVENSYGDVNRRVDYNERVVQYCRRQPRTASKIAEHLGLTTGYCRTVLLNPLCYQGSLKKVVLSGENCQRGVVLYETVVPRKRKGAGE